MARYIDADKAIEITKTGGYWETEDMEVAVACIEQTPTADVVEVVRCRNCKHAFFQYNMKDTLQEIYACRKRPTGRAYKKVGGDFFCKHGERSDT